jgi:hypothetical protein
MPSLSLEHNLLKSPALSEYKASSKLFSVMPISNVTYKPLISLST